ncbi:peptidase family M3 [Chromatiales bacterium (ex Bugula neritina AB1)]|nr:peptidase family M3 [Chromatiales bacterium (ex Bugula neritina AB1)]
MSKFQTQWDNSAFYKNSEDPEISTAVDQMALDISRLSGKCEIFLPLLETESRPDPADYNGIVDQLADCYIDEQVIAKRYRNTAMFVHSCLSVNACDSAAATWQPKMQQIGATLSNATQAMYGFLARAPTDLIAMISAHEKLAELSFKIEHLRAISDQLLPVEQEQLLNKMAVTGLHGWGNLYKNLAGTLMCSVGDTRTGLANAANQLSSTDRSEREQAWRGINAAWSEQEQAVAAILNNINGWRIEESASRSHTREIPALDRSCHSSKITRPTLDALMEATYQRRSLAQRVLRTMARTFNIETLGPWDLAAPAPTQSSDSIAFADAIKIISQSFSVFSLAMGAFAIEMAERGWIDCEETENRSTGAYCGSFADPREPRIFITYTGTMTNVITLAHELGHAWHNRVMQDLPEAKIAYPMTLAETASIFAETLVRDSLLNSAQTDEQRLEILWAETSTAAALLLNIPSRYEFEKQLVHARQSGFITAEKLKETMKNSWATWYEDSLSEYDDMFWASKLHFSISGFGFYNYPYLFGYLFSLGIYAQKDEHGENFEALYRDILRDTGSMTAETLVEKHLSQDISHPGFWQASLDIVEKSVEQFESLAGKVKV